MIKDFFFIYSHLERRFFILRQILDTSIPLLFFQWYELQSVLFPFTVSLCWIKMCLLHDLALPLKALYLKPETEVLQRVHPSTSITRYQRTYAKTCNRKYEKICTVHTSDYITV